jgi:hypothetical protein
MKEPTVSCLELWNLSLDRVKESFLLRDPSSYRVKEYMCYMVKGCVMKGSIVLWCKGICGSIR